MHRLSAAPLRDQAVVVLAKKLALCDLRYYENTLGGDRAFTKKIASLAGAIQTLASVGPEMARPK